MSFILNVHSVRDESSVFNESIRTESCVTGKGSHKLSEFVSGVQCLIFVICHIVTYICMAKKLWTCVSLILIMYSARDESKVFNESMWTKSCVGAIFTTVT